MGASRATATDRSIVEIVEFVRSALQARAVGFYWLDPQRNMLEVSQVGMPDDFHTNYHAGVGASDPCLARRLAAEGKRVAFLHDERGRVAPTTAAPYFALMRRFSFLDSAEMIFWKDDLPYAGLGVLKHADDPHISDETVTVARALQSHLEQILLTHPHMRQMSLRSMLSGRFGLSHREIEVVELIAQGCSNGDIAAILDIGVATVKTHAIRCFDKLGVKNRAALIAFTSTLG